MTTKSTKTAHRIRGRHFVPIAASLILVFALGFLTDAAFHKSGFALSGSMNPGELQNFLDNSVTTSSYSEDADGNVHFYDENGKEVTTLSAEEAKHYFESRTEAERETVQNSTTLVDIDAFPISPSSITELFVSHDGDIPDFALGNGHMVILYPHEDNGYALHTGEHLTLTVKTTETCHLSYFLIRDGKSLEEQSCTDYAQLHSHTFDITEDGRYYVALMYASAAADNFTNGKIKIE